MGKESNVDKQRIRNDNRKAATMRRLLENVPKRESSDPVKEKKTGSMKGRRSS